MQLYNLFRPLQNGTHRVLKTIVSSNPDLVSKYVNAGIGILTIGLKPINSVMRHLLTVQGLDPDSVPGEKQRELLQKVLYGVFSEKHDDAFDPDYDFSWINQKFEETRNRMKELNLTKEKFRALTDLSRFSNETSVPFDKLSELNVVAPETPKHELPLDTKEGRNEYRKRVLAESVESLKKEVKFDPIGDLREAIVNIEKEADRNIKEEAIKKGIKTAKKKLNKTTSPRGSGTRVNRTWPTADDKLSVSEPEVKSGVGSVPARDLRDIANSKRAQKKPVPVDPAEMKSKLERARALTDRLVKAGLCLADEKSREEQAQSMINWTDESYAAMERVIDKYAPTKDAIAENKFKGSFRRVNK